MNRIIKRALRRIAVEASVPLATIVQDVSHGQGPAGYSHSSLPHTQENRNSLSINAIYQ
jgi:hypothetical protein